MTDELESFECTLPHGKFTIRKHGRFCSGECAQYISRQPPDVSRCKLLGTSHGIALRRLSGCDVRCAECLSAEVRLTGCGQEEVAPPKRLTVLYVMPSVEHGIPWLRVSTNAGVVMVPASDALECGRAALDKALKTWKVGEYYDK